MKVAIVSLHFLNQALTEQFLESVKKLKAKGFELSLLVVNTNPKEDLKALEKKYPEFDFIKTKKNVGFTGGNNLGIKKVLAKGADWVFLVNNDTILPNDFLTQLLKVAQKDPEIGVLGPKIYFAPGCEYHRNRYKPRQKGKVFWYAGGKIDWQNVLSSHRGVDEVDQGQYDQASETDFVSGCAMLIPEKVFDKIGFLDEKYFLYLEDVDFCQRAKKAGFKVVYTPKAKLWHANAGSSQVGGPLHDYFLTRNRLLFGLRYAPWRAKIALIKESVGLWLTGRPWQKTAVKDFYTRHFGRGSWHEKKK